eukprot:10343077-Ditylum_brightwellii.AAC.1
MNEGQQLYLNMYCKVDAIDHFIKNMQVTYRSRKYWHSPKLHGTCMTTVVAYDICLKVPEGEICQTWRDDDPMNCWEFRDRLSIQKLTYKPTMRFYPGDENVCINSTKQGTQKTRKSNKGR